MRGDEIVFRMMVAHRVLAIGAGLSQAERLVGAALLGHYNTKQGRCDPGVDRLCALLNMHRATVFRAIKGLEEQGLFERRRYGGKSHRNAYRPIWDAFLKLNDQSPSATVNGSEPSHQETGEPSHQETTNVNELNEDRPTKPQRVVAPNISAKGQAGRRKPTGQGYLIHPLPGGRSPSHEDAATGAQQRRLAADISRLPRHLREAAWLAAMDAPTDGRQRMAITSGAVNVEQPPTPSAPGRATGPPGAYPLAVYSNPDIGPVTQVENQGCQGCQTRLSELPRRHLQR